jgi:hypothetical protein
MYFFCSIGSPAYADILAKFVRSEFLQRRVTSSLSLLPATSFCYSCEDFLLDEPLYIRGSQEVAIRRFGKSENFPEFVAKTKLT